MQRRPHSANLLPALVGFALLTGYACKKVIQVDLKNAVSRIVIEGEVTNTIQPYEVRISKTVNFSAGNTYPPVTGARVTITDSSARTSANLREASPAVYPANASMAVPEHNCTLVVIAH